MIEFRMTVKRHNTLRGCNILQHELETAGGFDKDREWKAVRDRNTGDYIFIQEEPKKKPVIEMVTERIGIEESSSQQEG